MVQVWNNLPNEVVSATCVSVFKSLLNSTHVSFLMLCLLCIIYVFWAVVSALWAFLPSRHSSFYCILLFYMLLILYVSTNKIYSLRQKQDNGKSPTRGHTNHLVTYLPLFITWMRSRKCFSSSEFPPCAWTLTYDFDHRTWPIQSQDESASSSFILFIIIQTRCRPNGT